MLLRVGAFIAIFLLATSSPRAKQSAIDRASIAAMFRDGASTVPRLPRVEINPTETPSTEITPSADAAMPTVELNRQDAQPPSVEVVFAQKSSYPISPSSTFHGDSHLPLVQVNPAETVEAPSAEVIPVQQQQHVAGETQSDANIAAPVVQIDPPEAAHHASIEVVVAAEAPHPSIESAPEKNSRAKPLATTRTATSAATLAMSQTLPTNHSPKQSDNASQPSNSQSLAQLPDSTGDNIESAWLDLRQVKSQYTKTQVAPDWVEAVTLIPPEAKPGVAPKTVFRIRLSQPRPDLKVLLFRLFFDDNSGQQPSLIAWDESGTQVIESKPLGLGINLASSETVLVPMLGVSTIDVEVPGDGTTVRGAYLDWMKSNEALHPLNAQQRDGISEPFAALAPLHAPETDTELFGAVTATLAAEPLSIGPSIQNGVSFQFGLEEQPLLALLSFEVANTKLEAPPEVYLNGQDIGPVILALPDLADPGYRGEMTSFVKQMQFAYTGWIRAQKLVPVDLLKVGTNDLLVISGAGTAASAIRATQIQLKYLWDKFDYILRPEH